MKMFKKLFLILGISLSLFSCKTTECYYIDGTEMLVIDDTLVFPSFHEHIEDDNCNKYCFYLEEQKYHFTDTIEVEIIKCKKISTRKLNK